MATRTSQHSYTEEQRQEIVAHVLAELSAGIPVSKTLGDDREEWLCSERCFWNWYYQDDADQPNSLVQKVARAREVGVEARIERALQAAETPMIGTVVTVEEDGESTVTKTRSEDMLGHRRLLVDTALKAAQMLKPKTYSPKLDVTSNGETLNAASMLEAARKRAQEGSSSAAE
jgi:hypothetical protein